MKAGREGGMEGEKEQGKGKGRERVEKRKKITNESKLHRQICF